MSKVEKDNLSWNNDTNYALRLYKVMGLIVGTWTFNCHEISSKIRFVIFFNLLLTMNCSMIGEFVIGSTSASNGVTFIGQMAATTVCMWKISVIRLQHKNMYRILESAIKDWSIVICEKSRGIMREYARRGRFVSIVQLTIAYVSVILVVMGALPTIGTIDTSETNNDSAPPLRTLLMSTNCFIVEATNTQYLAFYFLQFLQIMSLGVCNFGTDSIFFGISMHLSGQFELLKNDVEQLDEENGESEKDVKEKFALLIKRHNHLTDLVNLVEDVFNIIIFVQLAASSLHIILLGLQMLFALRDHIYASLVFAPIAISHLLLQLFMYSYVGDYLATKTKEVRDAAYNCSWYKFSPSFTKDVMFVIMRSDGTFYLTAGKIFRMNFEGFTTIIKTMMSFFSVMKLTIID